MQKDFIPKPWQKHNKIITKILCWILRLRSKLCICWHHETKCPNCHTLILASSSYYHTIGHIFLVVCGRWELTYNKWLIKHGVAQGHKFPWVQYIWSVNDPINTHGKLGTWHSIIHFTYFWPCRIMFDVAHANFSLNFVEGPMVLYHVHMFQ
jgi:hypothetical protein